MKNTIIPLGSYTSAQKASRYLGNRGIRSRVVKTGRGMEGCRFGISVPDGSAAHICGILAEIGIRCEGSMPVPPYSPSRPHHPHHRR